MLVLLTLLACSSPPEPVVPSLAPETSPPPDWLLGVWASAEGPTDEATPFSLTAGRGYVEVCVQGKCYGDQGVAERSRDKAALRVARHQFDIARGDEALEVRHDGRTAVLRAVRTTPGDLGLIGAYRRGRVAEGDAGGVAWSDFACTDGTRWTHLAGRDTYYEAAEARAWRVGDTIWVAQHTTAFRSSHANESGQPSRDGWTTWTFSGVRTGPDGAVIGATHEDRVDSRILDTPCTDLSQLHPRRPHPDGLWHADYFAEGREHPFTWAVARVAEGQATIYDGADRRATGAASEALLVDDDTVLAPAPDGRALEVWRRLQPVEPGDALLGDAVPAAEAQPRCWAANAAQREEGPLAARVTPDGFAELSGSEGALRGRLYRDGRALVVVADGTFEARRLRTRDEGRLAVERKGRSGSSRLVEQDEGCGG